MLGVREDVMRYYWIEFLGTWSLWKQLPNTRTCMLRLYKQDGFWIAHVPGTYDIRGRWADLEEAKARAALPYVMEKF